MADLNPEVVWLVTEFADECRAGRADRHTLTEYARQATGEANRRAVMALGETALLLSHLFKMRRGEPQTRPAAGGRETGTSLYRPDAHN